MTQEIDVQTLQEWLAQGRPVRVIDVRSTQDRELWWIPGSQHVDAYASLKEGAPGALADISLPEGEPVVTVCNLGRLASMRAAEILTAQGGNPVLTLRGGMKAWSLAWNTASRSFGPIELTQVRRTGKGCLSYMIRVGAEAAVVDPSVESEVYSSLAQAAGAHIRWVLDTHIHADHLSRALRLAEVSGAELVLPRQDKVRYPHNPVTSGDKLALGATWIEVIATPGHTDESVTYLVPDVGIFSGDTLFLTGVGRPDLDSARAETEARARQLFHSLVNLVALEADLLVFPGHTSEPVPFDGELLTDSVGEVASRLGEWLSSEEGFVNRILARILPTPPNYLVISQVNATGEWPESDPTDLEAGANRCAVS